jgi:hypothetical protein
VIFQVFMVSLIQCLAKMNGNTTFPDFKEKNGNCQLNTCWIFMILFIDLKLYMRMFRSGSSFFSLEGIAREWCRSLPNASVSSLTDFHSAFNSFCKDYFPVEYLFEGCCEEFSSFHKALFVEEDTYHVGQEVLKDNSDIFDIISNVSVVLNIDENQHVSFGCIDVEKPMHISTRKSNRSTYLRSVANTMRSPHISDLQT